MRVDTHIYTGYEVSPYYDSLVAKVITRGNNRAEAIQTMVRALNEFIISPIKTTIPFHLKLLEHPQFLKGEISTHFVQDMLKTEGKTEE